jgi:hypothetical protein
VNRRAPPPRFSALFARLIDEDVPHRLGRRAKEVTFAGEGRFVRQSQVRFVHQGGGVEGLSGVLSPHLPGRETA